MAKVDSPHNFITRYECENHVFNLREAILDNQKTNDKILKILQGNGEGGLIWKVNALMMRNQWIDRGFAVIISIASTLLTLYLTGVLNI